MKIYTYKNPFEINKMSIWNDIKKYPHLCVSQTLVEGMKEYYGRENFGVLCTLDQVLKKVYKDWHDNTEGEITQMLDICQCIEKLDEKPLKQTMLHNKTEVLKSIRYLIESDIDADIDTSKFSEEQQLLFEVYKEVEDQNVFTNLLGAKCNKLEDYYAAFLDILRDELKKYIKNREIKKSLNQIKDKVAYDRILLDSIDKVIKSIQKELNRQAQKRGVIFRKDQRKEEVEQKIEQASIKLKKINTIKELFLQYKHEKWQIDYDKIFIHGVHQFTPLILKLIHDLEEAGAEVIFLFNYMPEYSEIYKTWTYVYEWVGKSEGIDTQFIQEGSDYLQQRELGETLSCLYQGDFSKISDYYGASYTIFDNLTSFSDYVSDVYEEAERDYNERYTEDSHTTPENDGKLMKLALMNEQFYAINGTEMNELLKLYFPEQFSSRHFLSYPVGQFIRSLYKMWDNNRKELVIKNDYMREALSLAVWEREGMPTPLEIFYNIEHCFEHEEKFEAYLEVLSNIRKVVAEAKDPRIAHISFFIYTPEEMDYFIQVIEDIKVIAEGLFSEKTVKVKKHYKELMKKVLENDSIKNNITDEEIEFVEEVNERLNQINEPMEQANITQIKETIHYYLEANNDNDHEAEWIVRDFEQIDGGILLAAAQKRDQKEGIEEKTFHYAGLSDENMLGKSRVQLPWPLDEQLFKHVQSPIAEICGICRSEYNYFLRYSLFYGTYFLSNNKKIALSYIKKMGDEEANPYSPFILMNIKAKEYKYTDSEWDEAPLVAYDNDYAIDIEMPVDDAERRCMRACFKRYLFNYCLDRGTYFNEDFYLDYVCKFFITYNYMRKHNTRVQQKSMKDQLDERLLANYTKYFPFLSFVDKEEIRNDIKAQLKKPLHSRARYDDLFVDVKMEYLYKTWKVENPESKTSEDEFKYFVKNMDEQTFRGVFKEFESFVEENQKFVKKEEHKAKVCEVCNQRYLCRIQ